MLPTQEPLPKSPISCFSSSFNTKVNKEEDAKHYDEKSLTVEDVKKLGVKISFFVPQSLEQEYVRDMGTKIKVIVLEITKYKGISRGNKETTGD